MVADLNGTVALTCQPGEFGYATAMAAMLPLGRESAAARAAKASSTGPSPSGLTEATHMPDSVKVPVLSTHTTSTRARPSIAGNSWTKHIRWPSRMTPTANANEVISTRPSGTIGTSAPTVRSTASRHRAWVVNIWV